jgi:hypothetical protein
LSRQLIPYERIDALGSGRRAGRLRISRWHLPGYIVGPVRSSELGTVQAYCTHLEPEALVIISAGADHLALSPAEPERFRRALIARLEPDERADLYSDPRRLEAALDPLLGALICAAGVFVVGGLGVGFEGLFAQRGASGGPGAQADGLIYLAALQLAVAGLNGGLVAARGRLEPVARHVVAAAALCVEAIAFISMLRLFR